MKKRGFTLFELLIVIAIIGILSTIVTVSITAVSVKKRNTQRTADVSTILNAIYQYALDNNNQVPSSITNATTTICRTSAASCAGLIDLSALTAGQRYLLALPTDPTSTSTNATGYAVLKNSYGRVTVFAPNAEGSTTVSITR